jgi:hypothetical protein
LFTTRAAASCEPPIFRPTSFFARFGARFGAFSRGARLRFSFFGSSSSTCSSASAFGLRLTERSAFQNGFFFSFGVA